MSSTAAKSPYAGHRFPPEVISQAVWLYFRFPLSLRMVEEMLAARGITVTHETVRQWALKFGQEFTNRIRRRLPQAGDKFALSEVPAARQLGPAAAGLAAPHLIGTAKRFFRPVPVCAAAVDLGQPAEQIGWVDQPLDDEVGDRQ